MYTQDRTDEIRRGTEDALPDLLDDPEALDARAAMLRAGSAAADDEIAGVFAGYRELELIVSSPDKLDARAAMLRKDCAATEAEEARFGNEGAAWFDGRKLQ